MNHHTTADFWQWYARLPEAVQRVANRHHELLRADPRHPSLNFKKIGRLWSVRAGSGNRALAAEGAGWLGMVLDRNTR